MTSSIRHGHALATRSDRTTPIGVLLASILGGIFAFGVILLIAGFIWYRKKFRNRNRDNGDGTVDRIPKSTDTIALETAPPPPYLPPLMSPAAGPRGTPAA